MENFSQKGQSSSKAFRFTNGFSKMSKDEKIDYVVRHYLDNSPKTKEIIKSFWHENTSEQKVFDEFSENTLSNFYFPFGVCPHVLINGELHCVPMVIEESSVVAAASNASKFWLNRGGFKAEVISTKKIGQVHMIWSGGPSQLKSFFDEQRECLIEAIVPLTLNMKERGGGLLGIELLDKTDQEEGYFQIWCEFETCDAMGANFINSVLEAIGYQFKQLVEEKLSKNKGAGLQVIMSILSNYTPDCLVKAWVECPISELSGVAPGMIPEEFVERFQKAVRIAKIDIHRATTHNKGIFNGIDAVALATGNDFRAIEACGHTFAARDGQYRGLTDCEVREGIFSFSLELPLALGTVGGLTTLHPLAKLSLDLLGCPSAYKLMQIAAVMGLAQNFAALRTLVTTGIQKGHMKMHLMNVLNQLEASPVEREEAKVYFEDKVISFSAVRDYLGQLRKWH